MLLMFHKTTRELPNVGCRQGLVSPKMHGFPSRTAMLFALGRRAVDQFEAGGLGTLEEFFRSWAERKMGFRAAGYYVSLQESPEALVLNFSAGWPRRARTLLGGTGKTPQKHDL